jgi:hypothetical protein
MLVVMISADRTLPAYAYLAPVIALLGTAVFQLWMPTNHDHAWQFYMAGQVLDGARLYIDVGAGEMHPPLITSLAMAMEWIGRRVGLAGVDVFMVFLLATAAAALYASWRLGARSPLLLAMLVLGAVAWPGYNFGQGDQLAVLWSLPYLTAAAAYADGRRLSRMGAIAVGIAAGLGMSMKPHFALLWVATEIYLAMKVRPRSLWRTESITILAVFIAYVVATALLTPQFFRLTWIPGLYVNFGRGELSAFILNPAALLLILAAAAVWRLQIPPENVRLTRVFFLGAVVLYIIALLQFKGWRYHWIPSEILSLATIGAALPIRSWLVPTAIAALSVVLTAGTVRATASDLVGHPYYQAHTVPLIQRYAGNGSYLVLAENPFAAFPLVTDSRVRWASPYMCLWMVPALYPAFWHGQPTQYPPLDQRSPVEREMFDRIWQRVERERPAVILLQRVGQGFDFAAYFSADARFAALFREYFEAEPFGPYRVAIRSDLVRPAAPVP